VGKPEKVHYRLIGFPTLAETRNGKSGFVQQGFFDNVAIDGALDRSAQDFHNESHSRAFGAAGF